MRKFQEIQDELERRRATLERRLQRIGDDMRRTQGPLDADSQERAVELENAPVLDALDASGHDELAEINATLERIAGEEFGVCSECGEDIPIDRLRVVPTTRTCAPCAA
jgi:RNA polymerase-binding transcription factor DksA